MALGEFDNNNLSGIHGNLVYALFLASTFISCVTALNMIIAIMSDTYGKVNDKKELGAREMKIAILSEYADQINSAETNETRFLILVTPRDDKMADESTWEGSVNKIRNSIDEVKEELTESYNSKIG